MFYLHLRRSVLQLPHAEEKPRLSGTWNKHIKKYLTLETELAREVLVFGLCFWIAFLHCPPFVDKIEKQS